MITILFYSFFLLISQFDYSKSIDSKGYFLQITDIHYDPFYETGSPVVTDCHNDKTEKQNKRVPIYSFWAGEFGTPWNCDTPFSLINATIHFANYLVSEYPLDFIVWTGDSVRHNGDPIFHPISLDEVEELVRNVTEMIKSFSNNLKVFPTIGNNDVFPHDECLEGPNKLLNSLSNTWSYWLDGPSKKTMEIGGYFVMKAQSDLKIIGLNTIYWANSNRIVEDCNNETSPGALQMSWLSNVLFEAEKLKEKVYLTGHIPPVISFYKPACLEAYLSISSKYNNTIMAHLYGHTHTDLFDILYNPDTKEPFGVLNVSPSVIPMFNPSLRVFEYNKQTKTITNIHQYYVDLDKANNQSQVTFLKEYDQLSAYNMNGTTLLDWMKLQEQIDTIPSIKELYKKYMFVSSGTSYPNQ